MNNIIDGKLISEKIKEELKSKIDKLEIKPGMAVISVGNLEASKIYVSKKCKMAGELGIEFNHYNYSENEDENIIINKIEELNNDKSVSGIIVQLPLPTNFNKDKIIGAISPLKDIDGLTIINQGKLLNGIEQLVPCTPLGIIKLLEYYNVSLTGKNVVIVGRSNLVGKPLFNLLISRNATVSLCHSKTSNLIDYTKRADIIISATGVPNLITSNMIGENAIVIDVGISRIDGKIKGDVSSDVKEKAKLITPVPGGVGPMTVVMLMYNVLKSYELLNS